MLNALVLQPWDDTAPDQLKYLTEKFDFTNASGSQFDIVRQAFSFDLDGNFLFHVAQRIKCTVVEITSVDKGFEPLDKDFRGGFVSSHRSGFDPCIAFPFPSMELIILLRIFKTHHQGAVLTVRSQPHIDTENLTIGC